MDLWWDKSGITTGYFHSKHNVLSCIFQFKKSFPTLFHFDGGLNSL